MPSYDSYQQYRPPLTEEDKARLAQAANEPKLDVTTDPSSENVDFTNVQVDPVVAEHIKIAMEQAEKQFAGWPVFPEENSVAERFPGVDPEGKYSPVDTKIAQRMAQIRANLESRDPDTQKYTNSLIHWSDVSESMKEIKKDVEKLSKLHRSFTRAAKLCHDPIGSAYLQAFSRSVETHPQVMQMELYLQGLEYASGVRTGDIPSEVSHFYKKYMDFQLLESRVLEAQEVHHLPQEISVEFQNLENKLKQTLFANPANWGKRADQVSIDQLSPEDVSDAIPPYACATANRVLDPLFNAVEKLDPDLTISRGNYIIIDGKTVREKMYEDYTAKGNDPQQFNEFYRKNVKEATGEYVAAGLMAGKRVEVFVPDKYGHIPDEPTQITKKGYEPSALHPVVMNGWEKFWSKFGFYKKKAKDADQYQRALDARERVKSVNTYTQIMLNSVNHPQMKLRFFGDELDRSGKLPTSVPNGYNVNRSALTTTAVCAMLKNNYSMQDIFDPQKLVKEKQQMGSEVITRMENGDQKWIGEVLFHGQRLIADFLDQATEKIDILDEKQLFHKDNQILFFAAAAAYDASVESKFCKKEYLQAAEQHAPGQGWQVAQDVDNRVNTTGVFFDSATRSLESRNQAAAGMVSKDDAPTVAYNLLNFEAARKMYKEKMAASPKTPMSKHFTTDTMATFYCYGHLVKNKPDCQSLCQLLQDKEQQKAIGKGMMTGDTQKLMKISIDPETMQCDFKMSSPQNLISKQANQPDAPQMGRAK